MSSENFAKKATVGKALLMAGVVFSAMTVWNTTVWAAPLDVGFDEDVVVNVADGATRTQTEAVRQEGA